MPAPHYHAAYEIYLLLNGERIYFINDQVFTVRKGDMIIINPHDLHRTFSTDMEEFERILINFTSEFIQPTIEKEDILLLPFSQGSRLVRFPVDEQPAVEQLLWDMLTECRQEKEGTDTYLRSLLAQLLVKIYRINLQATQEPTGSVHPMHQKISEIASYLNRNYSQNVTLAQVAKQFYISPSYLSRSFNKVTGFHLHEFVQIIRVREAQRLLRETRDKVLCIAETVGFEHISHFNKTFKKITGMSPLQYRKRSGNIPVKTER